jgi:3-oxoacyl-[acyl-carrier-protein] synthase II
MNKRVVITGLGCVTPLGTRVQDFWRRLVGGERAIARIERFDPEGLRNEKAGEVKGWQFSAEDFGLAAVPSLASQFALHAAREALLDAGLPVFLDNVEAGAVLSTNFGGADLWEEYVDCFLAGDPRSELFRGFSFDGTGRLFREALGIRGSVRTVSMACSSGTVAIGLGADMVRSGRVRVAVAGGHDCLALTPLAGLSNLRTITPDDIKPFSADRSGTIFGEGAGYVVLEDLENARLRGARVYAEVLGWWENNNGYHMTAPDREAEGMTAALFHCLRASGMGAEEVDYINAHGTGTEYHDPAETLAIKKVLGPRAYEIPVSSIKGAVGHLMGAAGAVEAIATALAIYMSEVPPTANYTEPDPECDLDYVPNRGRKACVRRAVSISAGIGGNNACVALGRAD